MKNIIKFWIITLIFCINLKASESSATELKLNGEPQIEGSEEDLKKPTFMVKPKFKETFKHIQVLPPNVRPLKPTFLP